MALASPGREALSLARERETGIGSLRFGSIGNRAPLDRGASFSLAPPGRGLFAMTCARSGPAVRRDRQARASHQANRVRGTAAGFPSALTLRARGLARAAVRSVTARIEACVSPWPSQVQGAKPSPSRGRGRPASAPLHWKSRWSSGAELLPCALGDRAPSAVIWDVPPVIASPGKTPDRRAMRAVRGCRSVKRWWRRGLLRQPDGGQVLVDEVRRRNGEAAHIACHADGAVQPHERHLVGLRQQTALQLAQ